MTLARHYRMILSNGGGFVDPGRLVLSGSPSPAEVDVAYSWTPTITGGLAPISYALSGSLPAGLSFDTETAEISGTPTAQADVSDLVITGTPAAGPVATLGPLGLSVEDSDVTLLLNDDDLDAALADHGTDGGVELLLASPSQGGSFASGRTLDLHPTARLTIKGANPAERTPLRSITLAPNFANVTLENLDHGDASLSTGYCILAPNDITLGPTDLILKNPAAYGAAFDYTSAGDYSIYPPTLRSFMEGRYTNLTIDGGSFEYLNNAIKPTQVAGDFTVRGGITLRRLYTDAVSAGTNSDSGQFTFKDYFVTQGVGLQSDAAGQFNADGTPDYGSGPHQDVLQFTNLAPDGRIYGMLIEGIIYRQDVSRGSYQGVAFATASNGGQYHYTQIRDCMNITIGPEPQAPGMEAQLGGFASRLWALREDPATAVSTSTSGFHSVLGEQPSVMADCVGESFAQTNGTQLVNCVWIPSDPAQRLAFYNSAFEGPFPLPANATKAEILATYRPKADGPLAAWRDAYDWDTGEAITPHRFVIGLSDLTDLELDATGNTGWLATYGGEAGMAWSITGTGATAEWADDKDGTNATSAATSGTLDAVGKFVRINYTAAGSYSTPRKITVTGNGESYWMVVATKADPAYVRGRVSNGGTAYSAMGTPASAAGQKVLWYSFRAKVTGPLASSGALRTGFKVIASGTSGVAFKREAISGSRWRTQIIGTSYTQQSDNAADDLQWRRYLICVDYRAGAAEPFQIWRDFRKMILVPGGAMRTDGTVTFNPATIFAQLGLFGEGGDGGAIVSGAFEDFIAWWGTSGTLPDGDDPDVIMSFNPDRIGDHGQGITGVNAKLAFWGDDAAAWNAGLTNRGDEPGMVMAKMAGTYTDAT